MKKIYSKHKKKIVIAICCLLLAACCLLLAGNFKGDSQVNENIYPYNLTEEQRKSLMDERF